MDVREEDRFKVSAEGLRKVITPKTKAFILNNPGNPGGCVYRQEELQAIADLAAENRFFIVSDEIYESLIYDGQKHISIASLNDSVRDLTFTVNGMSKAYAMTGWRLGYAAGPSHIIGAAGRVQEHTTSCVNSITQKACVTALNEEDDSIENMRKEFWKRRDYMYDMLMKIPHVVCKKPQGAFYIMPDISWYLENNNLGLKTSAQFCNALLEKHHVAMVDGGSFGVKGTVRFSYANSMENITKGVNRFISFLQEISS
ncbi:MAG TPA: hypothetical protein DHW79_10995 [Candidatus Cloacimonas sp.]|nr:hypothetical protein [Candidatus Cloacimonas sp.]